MMFRALAVALIALASAGCGQSQDATSTSALPDDAVVTYRFHDASVPPEFHRSVTVTASSATSRIVIDSYGDVLADESVPTSRSAWEQLAGTLDDIVGLTVETGDEGCTGGTSIDLEVVSGGEVIVDLSPQFCGDVNPGVDEAIDAWIAPVRDQFAPTDVLAPERE